ncbi:hypothetical protein GL263_25860 [Streptomyces durbertensis]|uniref:Uncharacterized protein n=1 Tax=Streptomyces durbertensis TaxID=2448886 RepID=A0ABR6EPV0_9ACTN|nr:hypothetical protein [Streptomyces durbertensis]MBB1246945.1 hypothetical protein [Streptomyces durbertensis]
MEQITMPNRPRVPAINCGTTAVSSRLDRHLSVMGGPAVPAGEAAEATTLMRELTTRDHGRSHRNRGARVLLFAPLRRLRRSLFGGGVTRSKGQVGRG